MQNLFFPATRLCEKASRISKRSNVENGNQVDAVNFYRTVRILSNYRVRRKLRNHHQAKDAPSVLHF